MKLLLICEYFPRRKDSGMHGGVETRAFKLATYMSKKYPVTVITSKIPGQADRSSIENLKIIAVGRKRKYSRKGNIVSRIIFMLHAIYYGLKIDFDVVEGSSFFGWFPAIALSRIKGKKNVLVLADLIHNYALDAGFFYHCLSLYERIMINAAQKIICISKTVQKNLVKMYNVGVYKSEVIYCGTDLDFITSLKVGLQPKYDICCVARLVPYKRIMDLIDAVHILKRYFPKIKCIIIGDGEEKSSLTQTSMTYNLSKNIIFSGYVKQYNDVLTKIKQSKIFCLPSLVEGFGIVTIEALAAKKPVILADIPINREVTSSKGAVFFPPKNSIQLAAKIKKILSQRTLYNRLASEAEIISRKYNWNIIAAQTQAFYEHMCDH